jgi:hypothetical protein
MWARKIHCETLTVKYKAFKYDSNRIIISHIVIYIQTFNSVNTLFHGLGRVKLNEDEDGYSISPG